MPCCVLFGADDAGVSVCSGGGEVSERKKLRVRHRAGREAWVRRPLVLKNPCQDTLCLRALLIRFVEESAKN
jgi:hypothetical protein